MREMKESHIPFCENIPINWSEIPNKYIFSCHSTKVGDKSSEYQLLSLTTSGVKEKSTTASGGKVPTSYDGYQTVEIGDMIFCLFDLDCSAVFSGLSPYNGMITSAYDVLRANPNRADNHFLEYWFQYVFSNRYYKMFSKNIRYTVTGEMFNSIYTPIPPIEEQKKIGSYLDKLCKKVDALIANQEAQIEKLKAYKQSLITEVVTKGIDPNVPMKDSGVEWVKTIPNNWDMVYPKALFAQRKDRALPTDEQLTASQQYGIMNQQEYMRVTGSRVVVVEKDFSILKHVSKGDFVISMRSFQGGLEYSEVEGCISSAYVMLKPNSEKVFPKYYRWLLKSSLYINSLQSTSDLIRDGQAMRFANFIKIWLPCPPIEEQQQIASYLDDVCPKIDSLIAIKQSKIEKLNQYKRSLIYEYVTGKKEVM